jgi:hypothetical protein
MTQSLYNKSTTFEIETVYSETKSITKKKDRQASAGGLFGAGREADGTVYSYKHSLPDQTPDDYLKFSSFLDTCFLEWQSWLTTQDLRISRLQVKFSSHHLPTDWSKFDTPDDLPHKEVTTD